MWKICFSHFEPAKLLTCERIPQTHTETQMQVIVPARPQLVCSWTWSHIKFCWGQAHSWNSDFTDHGCNFRNVLKNTKHSRVLFWDNPNSTHNICDHACRYMFHCSLLHNIITAIIILSQSYSSVYFFVCVCARKCVFMYRGFSGTMVHWWLRAVFMTVPLVSNRRYVNVLSNAPKVWMKYKPEWFKEGCIHK